MNGPLARRMRWTFAATIASVLILVTIVIATAGYALEIGRISRDASYAMREIPGALGGQPLRSLSAQSMLASIMERLYHPGLTIYTSSNGIGYTGKWSAREPHYTISVDPQANVPFGAQEMPGLEHVSFYVARVAGYTGVVSNVGAITVVVQADRRALYSAFLRYAGATAALCALIVLLSTILAYRITDRALTPLMTVLTALESFAAGDLTPRLVDAGPADPRDELGRLGIAYNGAIATVDRALSERQRAEAQMRQFIQDAGHQLQTPLTVLRGFIGILRRHEIRDQEDVPWILETMDAQSAIMAELIKKLMLLQSWEGENGRPAEPIDVGALVKEIAVPIATANPGHAIDVAASDDAWARLSRSEATYAVSNLIDNAVKYSSEGEVAVRVSADELTVYVTVADRGAGIPPEDLERIFDRFYRGTRRDVPGSGLGLPIAKRAVERANGTLTVESIEGSGSCFTIALPRVHPASS